MHDAVLLWVFVFLMVSNMLLSLFYAFGTRGTKQALRRAAMRYRDQGTEQK